MKVVILYSSHCKEAKLLAEDMARYAKTYARPLSSFDFKEDADLLVIGFENLFKVKDKELEHFISNLSREHIKNLALFNMFYFNNKQMDYMIKYCQKQNLPLMRETYSAKKNFKPQPVLKDDILSGGRVYIEDMINVCRHYY